MTALRIINLIVWLSLAVYMLPAVISSFCGVNTRYGDPMRVAVFATCLVIAGFSLRWLIAPENEAMWRVLYILSAADALYIALLARTYGRGHRVGR